MSRSLSDLTECTICGAIGQIDQHHLVPRRYGAPDASWNLAGLCRDCHQAVEAIYTDDVWHWVGLHRDREQRECHTMTCGATTTSRYRVASPDIGANVEYDFARFVAFCGIHSECDHTHCNKTGKPHYMIMWHEAEGGLETGLAIGMLCKRHTICQRDGCGAEETVAISRADEPWEFRCRAHMHGYRSGDRSLRDVLEALSEKLVAHDRQIEDIRSAQHD